MFYGSIKIKSHFTDLILEIRANILESAGGMIVNQG